MCFRKKNAIRHLLWFASNGLPSMGQQVSGPRETPAPPDGSLSQAVDRVAAQALLWRYQLTTFHSIDIPYLACGASGQCLQLLTLISVDIIIFINKTELYLK